MTPILDRLNRPLHDVRISVTDRCNLRCGYCMPRSVFGEGFQFLPHSELLSFEEITRVCQALLACGMRRVRLTGGEPLLRRDLHRLVAMLAALEGIEEISMTTNGTLLRSKAAILKEAGLSRVTVSLDAIDEKVFQSMSDSRMPIAKVLAGIEEATAAGLAPVKVNVVVRRGVNDHCVLDLAERFRGRPETVRFIEYMDVGETNDWRADEVVPASELIAAINARWPLTQVSRARPGEVASRYRYLDGAGEVGFIHSISQPFCGSCDRIRLSSDGKLYTCLFARSGHDLRAAVRSGASDAQLVREIESIWRGRVDRYSELRSERAGGDEVGRRLEMSYIGG